jgi:CO/xanthine dehydrogenase FAD-binding subunit
VLLVLDASFVLGGPRGERTVPADEFWVAYRRTALAPDELILRLRIPLASGRESRFRKIGTRRAQAISKVVLALSWRDGVAGPRGGRGRGAAGRIRAQRRGAMFGWPSARSPIARSGAAAEASSRARHRRDGRRCGGGARCRDPADWTIVRSTADYRRVVAARSVHRMIREAGGW